VVIAVGIALVVAGVWYARPHSRPVPTALEGTVSVAITRHDANGWPSKPRILRDRPRVRAFVAALGVDEQPAAACPADYATAAYGIVLNGSDIYGRRNVYVWSIESTVPTVPTVLVVTSSGCRSGPSVDAEAVRRELSSTL
jgi:hypothetical protein